MHTNDENHPEWETRAFTIWTKPEKIKGEPVQFKNDGYGSVYVMTVLFRVYKSVCRLTSTLLIEWKDGAKFYDVERRGN